MSTLPKELANGRFIIGEKLIERPSCFIYKAKDKQLGDREVAVKFYVDQADGNIDWINAFDREVSVFRNASHRCLVPIIAGGLEENWFYVVMELIDGMNLHEYLKGLAAPLDSKVAVEIVSKIALALKEIHEKNSYHGHLDSRAILFKAKEPRLAGYYPRVLTEIHKSKTSTGRMLVHPGYIAPEQISSEKNADARVDIYALGVLLYEMLTLEKPFKSENQMQMAMLRMTSDPQSVKKLNSDISSLLDAAIMKALARNPQDRFTKVDDFIDALTGGKSEVKNPLLESMGNQPERISGTETIAVSMSTDSIKEILKDHERRNRQEKDIKIKQEESTPVATKQLAAAEPLAVDSTMIGMKFSEVLKANIVIVSEDSFGKQFVLGEKQTTIGGHSVSDIQLSGKNVPPHAAMIINKNSNYYLSVLSSDAKISVNSKTVTIGEDYQLSRGDVIECAGSKLRYVAPGEVFTLQKDVADRVIDRPKSKLPKYLGVASATVLVIAGILLYSYKDSVFQAQNSQLRSQESKKLQKKELIDKLRKEGDEFFKTGILIEPVEANARKRFEQIIELDPDDTYAKRRLSDIEERLRIQDKQADKKKMTLARVNKLLQDAEGYFKSKKYIAPIGANAKELYEEVLKLDPENEVAKKQIAEINNILGDLVARISGLLSVAKEQIDKKQFVSPEGDNAKESIEQIFAIDPKNEDAHKLLIEIAARAIIQGDKAKGALKAEEMKQSYLIAQAVGVDPEFIKSKMQGADIISKSKSSVVIVDTGTNKDSAQNDKKNSAYLDSSEINKRISVLKLQNEVQGESSKSQFYEINKK